MAAAETTIPILWMKEKDKLEDYVAKKQQQKQRLSWKFYGVMAEQLTYTQILEEWFSNK